MRLLDYVRKKYHPLWRLRRMPAVYRFLSRFLDVPRLVNDRNIGFKYYAYGLRNLTYFLGTARIEPIVQQVLLRCIQRQQVCQFWDVGANLGFYTWLVLSSRPDIQCVLVEPVPDNTRLLELTINKNRLEQCRLVKAAIAARAGSELMTIDQFSGATSQMSSLYVDSPDHAIAKTYALTDQIEVATTTLDILMEQYGVPDVIKMDIEHAELFLPESGARLVNARRSIFIFECQFNSVLDWFGQNGYCVFKLDDLHNFMAVPRSRVDDIKDFAASFTQWATAENRSEN